MKKRGTNSGKRGLSPVIATVLLIGIVVVTALIIFMWFRGLTQEAITKFDQNIQLVCDDVKFQAGFSGANTLSISNSGNVPIYRMRVKDVSGDGNFETNDIIDVETSPNWPETGLAQGQVFSSPVEISGESIVLIPILRGNSQRGGEASFVCDEQYGQEISTL